MKFAVIALFVCAAFFAKGQQVINVDAYRGNGLTDTLHLCSTDAFPTLISYAEGGMNTDITWLFNGEPVNNNRLFKVLQTGAYTLVVTTNGNSYEKTIVVDMPIPYACETIIPNVFTPNGDGHNDSFSILNIEHYPNSTLQVFARWGRKVFESNNYRNQWNGADLADGTYFFIFKRNDGQEFKGSVTILR